MRRLEIVRGGWALTCLVAPGLVLRRAGGDESSAGGKAVMRVLGARQLAQAVLSGARPSAEVLAVGAWVDAVHSATALGLGALDGKRRHAATVDALVAAGFAALGRRDVPAAPTGGRRWQDRAARALLPILPGAPELKLAQDFRFENNGEWKGMRWSG